MDNDPRDFWNARFSQPGAMYGDLPNDFLAAHAAELKGPVLSLGEGEGRNACFLAARGLEVTALDISEVGSAKTLARAKGLGLTVHTVVADLKDYVFEPGRWGTIISLWCHLPLWLRPRVHEGIVSGLTTGGHLLLEAYTPRQLKFGTGGPKTEDMLYEPDGLRADFAALELSVLTELERDVTEGSWHNGRSAVVQLLGMKP
jgi:SAM-dependent methyltransferase